MHPAVVFVRLCWLVLGINTAIYSPSGGLQQRLVPAAAWLRAAARPRLPPRKPPAGVPALHADPPALPYWSAQPGSSAGVGFAIPVDVVKSSVEQVGGAAGW